MCNAVARRLSIQLMERLSGLDASFLYVESATIPLHVCSVVELDTSTIPGGYTFDRLRDDLALRIKALPEFRAKLADSQLNLDHPVWVEDKDFDLSRHLYRIGVPSPGGRTELAEACAHIAQVPLDRSKPMWEMWVLEAAADTDVHEVGPIRLMIKVHHSAVDGVGAANLLNKLCSLEPDAPPPDPVDGPGRSWKLRGTDEVPLASVAAGQGDARDDVDDRQDSESCAQRHGHGRTVRRSLDGLQRGSHLRTQHRLRAAGPRRCEAGEEPVRRQGQRRGDGAVRRRAARVSA